MLEPDEMFALIENFDGIRVWAEKALVPRIEYSNFVSINLKKGILKSLKVEICSQMVKHNKGFARFPLRKLT